VAHSRRAATDHAPHHHVRHPQAAASPHGGWYHVRASRRGAQNALERGPPALYSGARTGARYLTTAAHRGVNALSGAGNEWIESNLGDGLPKKKPAKGGKKGGAIGFTPYGMPVRMLAPARRAPARRAPARRAPVKRRVGGGGRMPGQQPPFRYGGAVTTEPYIFRI
jgi:hypothetical protein